MIICGVGDTEGKVDWKTLGNIMTAKLLEQVCEHVNNVFKILTYATKTSRVT